MYSRMVLTFPHNERDALIEMARRDLRDPRDQLRYLLRDAARQRGLLPDDQPTKEAHDATQRPS